MNRGPTADGARLAYCCSTQECALHDKQQKGKGPAQLPRLLFGYHPHGLYPAGAMYLPLLPAFQRLLGCFRPVTMTASVLHFLPLIRDLMAWANSRIVSQASLLHALRTYGPVLLCPGGQEELVEAWRVAGVVGGSPTARRLHSECRPDSDSEVACEA